jgi:ParB family chromosome partitioning protein
VARRRRSSADVFGGAVSAAADIHRQDQAAEAQAQTTREQRSRLPLTAITARSTDTRPLKSPHVTALVESIGVLGLIEPLVVDERSRLLAGAHRLAAVQFLQAQQPDAFDQHFPDGLVPVRVMPFDAEAEPERALQVELAENEKRVNYSRDQIEKLAVRLRQLNYKDTRGRPKKGEKALGPALAVAIGVSTRYVRKVLGEEKITLEENRNSVPIFRRKQLLKRLEDTLQALQDLPETDAKMASNLHLDETIPELLRSVQASLQEL